MFYIVASPRAAIYRHHVRIQKQRFSSEIIRLLGLLRPVYLRKYVHGIYEPIAKRTVTFDFYFFFVRKPEMVPGHGSPGQQFGFGSGHGSKP